MCDNQVEFTGELNSYESISQALASFLQDARDRVARSFFPFFQGYMCVTNLHVKINLIYVFLIYHFEQKMFLLHINMYVHDTSSHR